MILESLGMYCIGRRNLVYLMIAGGIILLGFYVYFVLALITIAKRTDTENPWLAWIPIANVYLMTKIGKVSPWTMLALLAPIIPFIGILITAGFGVYWWWRVAEARGKPGWYGMLMLVPIVNLVILGILAWGN